MLQKPQGMLYRTDVTHVNVTGSVGQYLDILVENQGRVGFNTAMNFMRKVHTSTDSSWFVRYLDLNTNMLYAM